MEKSVMKTCLFIDNCWRFDKSLLKMEEIDLVLFTMDHRWLIFNVGGSIPQMEIIVVWKK